MSHQMQLSLLNAMLNFNSILCFLVRPLDGKNWLTNVRHKHREQLNARREVDLVYTLIKVYVPALIII